ncbi:MAG: hypothetical protein ACYC8T_20030 [Myxococcaceae bacterium]
MRIRSARAGSAAPARATAAARPQRRTGRPAADGFQAQGRPGRGTGLEAMLQAASSARRSDGPEGAEPLLNPREAARVGALFATLPAAPKRELTALLSGLTGPGAVVARGLLLRAISARAGQLPTDPGALTTLRDFAARLGAMSSGQMLAHATVLDLDSRSNDSAFDPQVLWDRRGTIHERPGATDAADNDGLFQRFTATCGPTVLQMMLAEADPVVAFALNDDGLRSDSAHGKAADFQREILESLGGVAIGRVEAQLRSRLKNALGRLRLSGQVTPAQCKALLDHALDRGPRDGGARGALEAVRKAYGGFPSEDELGRLKSGPLPKVDAGVDSDALTGAMGKLLGPLTGLSYRATSPAEGFGRGQAARYLDEVSQALRRGDDVPFGVAEPAHWMLLTAVKGRKPAREFLVSDPDGGRTAWVSERDFVRGTFGDRQFHLNTPSEKPYVDSFLLPIRS